MAWAIASGVAGLALVVWLLYRHGVGPNDEPPVRTREHAESDGGTMPWLYTDPGSMGPGGDVGDGGGDVGGDSGGGDGGGGGGD